LTSAAKRRLIGFSVIELMVTVAVLSILLVLVAPSFQTTIQNNRLYTQVNDFHLSLSRARSAAMSRVQRVTVCASADGATCSNSGIWENGWIVFSEHHDSQNATVDPNDVILEIKQALSGNTTLRGDSDVTNYVSYAGTGFTTLVSGSTQTGKFALCDNRGLSDGKALLINAAGRPRVVAASGNVSSCTAP